MEMVLLLPPDQEYHRVTTPSTADYVPPARTLDTCEPMLNTINPSALIITEFQNWAQHTNLGQKRTTPSLTIDRKFWPLSPTRHPKSSSSQFLRKGGIYGLLRPQ